MLKVSPCAEGVACVGSEVGTWPGKVVLDLPCVGKVTMRWRVAVSVGLQLCVKGSHALKAAVCGWLLWALEVGCIEGAMRW